jgi:photosystem II stability/assembly factor-like uncharacterized protein
MKSLVILVVSFLLLNHTVEAQNGWFWQNPLPQGNHLYDVQVFNPYTLIAVGDGGTVIKTTDGGENWNFQTSGTSEWLESVHFTDQNTGWIVGWDGTILKTTDGGGNWHSQISGTDFHLYSVYFINNNTGWIVGKAGTILNTTDGGINWSSQTSGTSSYLFSVFFIDRSIGWVVGGPGAILKTTNGGSNWYSQTSGTSSFLRSVYFINNNTGWTVGAGGTILMTTDGGVNWISQISGTIQGFRSVAFADNNTGWAVGGLGTILKTIDGGTNWNSQNSRTATGLQSVYFTDHYTGWAVGTGGTILYTLNGGVPVELVSFNTDVSDDNVSLSWITASELNNSGFEVQRENHIKKNGWNKISFIKGSGTTTEIQTYSFNDKNVPSEKYQYRLKQLDYDGTFEYSNVIQVEVKPPNIFALHQNFPNPFNPTTAIKYQIPELNFVTLKVYDVLGKEVAILVNEEKPAGTYEVEFKGTSLPSGIYFYQLKTDSYIKTRKMVLIK